MDRDGIAPTALEYRVIECEGLKRRRQKPGVRTATAAAASAAAPKSDSKSSVHAGSGCSAYDMIQFYDAAGRGSTQSGGGAIFLPSPNMPSASAAHVFLSTVLIEAIASVSEGRGSTRPFHLFGAPTFQPNDFIRFIEVFRGEPNPKPSNSDERVDRTPTGSDLTGISLSSYSFRPTFNKFASQIVHAGLITPILSKSGGGGGSGQLPNLYALGVLIVLHFVLYYPNEFRWRPVELGYEYNFTEPAINLLLGVRSYKEWFDSIRDRSSKLVKGSRAWSQLVESAMSEARIRLHASWTDSQKFAADTECFWLY